MSNAPPTPPPITTIEIEDEAKNTSASAPRTSSDPANPSLAETAETNTTATTSAPLASQSQAQLGKPNVYESSLPRFSQLVADRQFRKLAQLAEEIDLTSQGENHDTRLLVIFPLVLAYLIVDDLPLARVALKRLTNHMIQPAITQTLGALLLAASERDYTTVYNRAEDFIDFAGKPNFPHAQLGTLIKNMIPIFVSELRERTFNLLSHGYSNITPAQAAKYIGLPIETVKIMANERGWTYDQTTETLTPTAISRASRGPNYTSSSAPSTLQNFVYISDSVSRLEMTV